MLIVEKVNGMTQHEYLEQRLAPILKTLTEASVEYGDPRDVAYDLSRNNLSDVFKPGEAGVEPPVLDDEIRESLFEQYRTAVGLLPGEKELGLSLHFVAKGVMESQQASEVTVVLRQETNLADCYFAANLGKLLSDSRSETGSNAVLFDPITDIASTIALSILSTVVGKIAAYAIDKVFPPTVPSYFREVYREMAKIVGNELTQKEMDDLAAETSGFVEWVRNDYLVEKNGGATLERLFALLEPQVRKLRMDNIAKLMSPRYELLGLQLFLVTAGSVLALVQEEAMVDPRVEDPNLSIRKRVLQRYAADYVRHVERIGMWLTHRYLAEVNGLLLYRVLRTERNTFVCEVEIRHELLGRHVVLLPITKEQYEGMSREDLIGRIWRMAHQDWLYNNRGNGSLRYAAPRLLGSVVSRIGGRTIEGWRGLMSESYRLPARPAALEDGSGLENRLRLAGAPA